MPQPDHCAKGILRSTQVQSAGAKSRQTKHPRSQRVQRSNRSEQGFADHGFQSHARQKRADRKLSQHEHDDQWPV